jgi:hypothetical protein
VLTSRYWLSDATGSEAKHAELGALNEAKLLII